MNGNKQTPGMKCPECGAFIPTSIVELLTASALICHNCHLKLSINRNESKQAMDILKKVNDAQNNVNKASKF